ncbi:MAG: N-acetyl-D-Glu racemase DgcA [Pseudomonadota bacterium]
MLEISVETCSFALREAFVISRGSRTAVETVEVRISDGKASGRGESVPYKRYGESVASVVAALQAMAPALKDGLDREALQTAMPAGAARNALDLAFWDYEAKKAGLRVWELPAYQALAGPWPAPVVSAYTLSIAAPEVMHDAAAKAAARPVLKVKLAGDEADVARIEAVRAGAPDARLIVDANEGWSPEGYAAAADAMAAAGVDLIEQPIHADRDAALDGMDRPVRLCADESCHTRATLDALEGRYDVVNIKLDKTGGLTEALAMRAEAEKRGFGVMVGCMMSSSLGVAPAVSLSVGAGMVDLDPPMLLGEDRTPALTVEGSLVRPPLAALWG